MNATDLKTFLSNCWLRTRLTFRCLINRTRTSSFRAAATYTLAGTVDHDDAIWRADDPSKADPFLVLDGGPVQPSPFFNRVSFLYASEDLSKAHIESVESDGAYRGTLYYSDERGGWVVELSSKFPNNPVAAVIEHMGAGE